jgi:hypothetical protein
MVTQLWGSLGSGASTGSDKGPPILCHCLNLPSAPLQQQNLNIIFPIASNNTQSPALIAIHFKSPSQPKMSQNQSCKYRHRSRPLAC